MRYPSNSPFRKTFHEWKWVLVSVSLCSTLFFLAYEEQRNSIQTLKHELEILEKKKGEILEIHENLQTQVNSQSDPRWVERIIMEKGGAIPEGYTKIFFKSP